MDHDDYKDLGKEILEEALEPELEALEDLENLVEDMKDLKNNKIANEQIKEEAVKHAGGFLRRMIFGILGLVLRRK